MANYALVSYGDFVRDLAATMTGPLADFGYQPGTIGDRVILPVNHTVSGNHNRVVTGEVVLTEDLRWRTQLSAPMRWLVGAASSRSLRHYGFH